MEKLKGEGLARHQRAGLMMTARPQDPRGLAATAAATAALAAPLALARADVAPEERPACDAGERPGSAERPTYARPRPGQAGETLAPPATKTPAEPRPSGGGVCAGPSADGEGAEEAALERKANGEPPAPSPDLAGDPLAADLQLRRLRRAAGPDPDLPARRRQATAWGRRARRCWPGSTRSRPASAPTSGPPPPAAIGWMQFMPATWAEYGVDANGDGVKDPYNPEDAIFAAACYLSVAGMPADTYGAIFAYNHADWYVSEVLANAGCYAARSRRPGLHRIRPRPADPGAAAAARRRAGRGEIPADYLRAFENAAARYELGKPRRLGAGGDRPPGVELRQAAWTGRSCDTRRPARARPKPSGRRTRSTATRTAGSSTASSPTRRRPWRGRSGRAAASAPGSSPTTRPSGTSRR